MHCCWSHLPLLNPQSGARVLTWLTCQDVAMQGLCPPTSLMSISLKSVSGFLAWGPYGSYKMGSLSPSPLRGS